MHKIYWQFKISSTNSGCLACFEVPDFGNLYEQIINFHPMINKKDRLSYLMLAQLVQQYAAPHVREGKLSLWQIFINHVHDKVPVTLNTFRKMMKEDISDLDAKSKHSEDGWRNSTTKCWRRNVAIVSERSRPASRHCAACHSQDIPASITPCDRRFVRPARPAERTSTQTSRNSACCSGWFDKAPCGTMRSGGPPTWRRRTRARSRRLWYSTASPSSPNRAGQ